MADNIKEKDSIYVSIGKAIGALVEKKNTAYGDSFSQSQEILKVLYPAGVTVEQYRDFLTITRIIDKLFRIANQKEAFDENPFQDIAGYSILAVWRDMLDKKKKKVEEQ